MTKEEIIDLLAFARVYDARVTLGKAETAAWFLALQRYGAGPAQEAIVAHYQASRERIMPADIIGHIRARQIAARDEHVALPSAPPASAQFASARRAEINTLVEHAAARFALKRASPDHAPLLRPGMDKQAVARAQVEASRRQSALAGRTESL